MAQPEPGRTSSSSSSPPPSPFAFTSTRHSLPLRASLDRPRRLDGADVIMSSSNPLSDSVVLPCGRELPNRIVKVSSDGSSPIELTSSSVTSLSRSPSSSSCSSSLSPLAVQAPMAECLATFGGGHPREEHASLYETWARGGWAMVITGKSDLLNRASKRPSGSSSTADLMTPCRSTTCQATSRSRPHSWPPLGTSPSPHRHPHRRPARPRPTSQPGPRLPLASTPAHKTLARR